MSARYLVDTDVLIEYLRGKKKAVAFLEDLDGDLLVSAITVAELFSGARDAEEKAALDQFLMAFQIVPIDGELAREGGLVRQTYHASHGVCLADALIAASAQNMGAALVTFNRRHYPMIEDVQVPYTRKSP